MDDAVKRRLLSLVGLGVRGRLVVFGVQQVRVAAQRNKLHYAVVATDAARNSLEKVVPMLNARRIPFVEAPTASELGALVDRDATAVVGVVDATLARGMRELVEGATPTRDIRGREASTRRKA